MGPCDAPALVLFLVSRFSFTLISPPPDRIYKNRIHDR